MEEKILNAIKYIRSTNNLRVTSQRMYRFVNKGTEISRDSVAFRLLLTIDIK